MSFIDSFLDEQLGGEIQINGDEVTYTGPLPQLPRSPTNESILSNKTNNFMQKLKYYTLHDLKPYHVRILQAKKNIIAYSRLQRNDYLVAAKPQDLYDLKSQLFPRSNPRPQPKPAYSLMNLHLNDR